MKFSYSELSASDPSKVNGWLIGVLGAVLGFLSTLTPYLDNVKSWGDAVPVLIGLALPKLTAALIQRQASKPSTVEAATTSAYLEGLAASEQALAKQQKRKTAKKTARKSTGAKLKVKVSDPLPDPQTPAS